MSGGAPAGAACGVDQGAFHSRPALHPPKRPPRVRRAVPDRANTPPPLRVVLAFRPGSRGDEKLDTWPSVQFLRGALFWDRGMSLSRSCPDETRHLAKCPVSPGRPLLGSRDGPCPGPVPMKLDTWPKCRVSPMRRRAVTAASSGTPPPVKARRRLCGRAVVAPRALRGHGGAALSFGIAGRSLSLSCPVSPSSPLYEFSPYNVPAAAPHQCAIFRLTTWVHPDGRACTPYRTSTSHATVGQTSARYLLAYTRDRQGGDFSHPSRQSMRVQRRPLQRDT